MFKNVASQKIAMFAYDSTTGAPKTGLTTGATLVPYVSKDYGTVTALGTATVTEMDATNAPGWYSFTLAQAESNADALLFSGKSSTANIYVAGQLIFTDPPNYSTFSIDSSGNAKADVAKLLGTAWLTPGTAGTPDVNTKLWNGLTTVALPLVPTTAGRTLDCSAGGEAGVDWANVGSPTTALALTGTTIAVTQKVDVDTIKTNPVVNAGTITFPTTATLASTTNITAGTIATVSGNVNGNVAGSVGSVTGAVGSVTGNVGGNVVGSVASVTAGVTLAASAVQAIWDALTSALTTVGSIGKLLVDNINAAISSRLASASYTAPTNLTAAQIATGVWQDTTAGDFTTALSVGKSVMNGVALGTGLTVNDITTKTGYALTSAYDFAKGTVAMTESYGANGAAPTPVQALYGIQQYLQMFTIATTTYTVKKLDNSTTAYVVTLNDAVAPTAAART